MPGAVSDRANVRFVDHSQYAMMWGAQIVSRDQGGQEPGLANGTSGDTRGFREHMLSPRQSPALALTH